MPAERTSAVPLSIKMNKMPKYMIATAADAGVTLQSLGQRKQIAINVQYGTHEISSSDAVGIPSISASIEVYGVAGIENPAK